MFTFYLYCRERAVTNAGSACGPTWNTDSKGRLTKNNQQPTNCGPTLLHIYMAIKYA